MMLGEEVIPVFGSGSGLDADQVSGSRFGSRRAEMTHKNRKKFRNFMF